MAKLTLGQKLADMLARGMGSWSFLIIQTTILVIWIVWNTVTGYEFDPYPFVFLNLVLSFQAAYAAPIIMMSSNRQEEIDRTRSINIYNLEKSQHKNIENLVRHIDQHFHQLNKRLDAVETKQSEKSSASSQSE